MKKWAVLVVAVVAFVPTMAVAHPTSEMEPDEMLDSAKSFADKYDEVEGKVNQLKKRAKNLRENFSLKGQLGRISKELGYDGVAALTKDFDVSTVMEQANFEIEGVAQGEVVNALKGRYGEEEYKDKLEEWGRSTINKSSFKKQMKGYNQILKGVEGDNLDKTMKGVGKYLSSAETAYNQLTNVQDSIKDITGRFKEVTQKAKEFGDKDLEEMMRDEAVQDALPSAITDAQDRAEQVYGQYKDVKEQAKNLPNEIEREKAEVKAMAQKMFTVPDPEGSGSADCRDLGTVQREVDQAQDSSGVDGGVNLSMLHKAEQLCKNSSIRVGKDKVTFDAGEMVKKAKEKAGSYEYIKKGIARQMQQNFSVSSGGGALANQAQKMQNERNRLMALAQMVRTKVVQDKKGSYARQAYEMAQKAPKRGIRHSLQALAYSQFMGMHQGGLELNLLNARFEQLAREASK